MLHRALFGSLERFLGILIEHHWGRFPLWLAPVQVAVLTITNEVDDYAYKIFELLRKNSIRTEIDLENEKINYKIRKHSLAKVPIILAVGRNEAQTNSVSVRRLGDTTQEILEINDFLNKLLIEATVF
jgi:threonyl-tRNA synthetase